MLLRALPLIVLSFFLYNAVVFLLPGGVEALKKEVLPIPLTTMTIWLTWSDILVLITMGLLFVELIKSTYTSTTLLLDHGLSMLVFVACLIEFLLVKEAATATFFIITVATIIDVIAGYTIGIRVARRDFSIGDH